MASSIKANADGTTSVLNGSGQEVLKIPSTAGTDVNVATLGDLAQKMTLMEAQTASGTYIDFTGIPSWAKRITVMFKGVSTNGTSFVKIVVGSGSLQTSGYNVTSHGMSSSVVSASYTDSFTFGGGADDSTMTRSGIFSLVNITNNIYIGSGSVKRSTGSQHLVNGDVSLVGTLDRIRITTVNGTDTFDAGSINIMYEG